VALMAGLAGAASAQDPVGKWTGMLATPNGPMPVGVTITKGPDGQFVAELESPSQAPGKMVPINRVETEGDALTLVLNIKPATPDPFTQPRGFVMKPYIVTKIPQGGQYDGKWDADKQMWVGTWKQDGLTMKLDFTRAS
jgi:hypothetical protein